ncbi:glutathione S-transferase family protein [Ramlibacter rhizophilus]|uniref:Glutathione S-transferase family protein n=1 Tax=Ramlibacter rhizophilus TaxID=1781167 RepID=A0A4Z0BF11_9BURK|nr:glutathione S-transferase N-terminal domain-containing protein [Ramlibacter rhizophilus]TFY97916.1 glutathione S-transferase family protein [Ramlibacter rhizophilus]
MTLKLYFAPGACSFVPHVLLELSGTPFEPTMVKLHKGEQNEAAYRAINSRGQVPVLVDGDVVITQILAIIGYLHDRFPEQRFLPTEPLARARVMEQLAWLNNTVHPTFTHVFMPYKFVDGTEAQAQVKAFNVGVYAKLLQELESFAARAVAQGPWLGGEAVGPLDAYALTVLRWGGIAGIDPERFVTLWSQAQKLAKEPAVARVIERERLQLNLYKPA